jgi:hypothetical protein
MALSSPERLARYIRSLSDFEFYETIDGNYNHIGATIADAVLQANMRYKTHVKPRVNRILSLYPNSRTTSSVMHLLKSMPATEFLSWRGQDRAERFSRILDLFVTEGIENELDLREWLSQDSNLSKLQSIKGIGPKTIDYFKILVGLSTSAIDRHLLNFLRSAGLTPIDYQDAQTIINSTADILSVDRAYLDHSIWQYMSKKATSFQVHECQNNGA